MLVFCVDTRIIFIKPNMMVSVDNKIMFSIPVNNSSCNIYISHEMSTVGYIIKILYCKTPICDLDSHTPYFDVFSWKSWTMPKELSNINMQPILALVVVTDGILIVEALKLFIVAWFKLKISCGIIKCLIWDLDFRIE